jgi:serine/threonine-protein kinase
MNKFLLFAVTNLLVLSSDITLNIFSVGKSSRVVVAQSSEVFVYDPPSNVRKTPNGQIICSVKTPTTIKTYGYTNGWYQTNFCGSDGYIHESQVRKSEYWDPGRTKPHACDNPLVPTSICP